MNDIDKIRVVFNCRSGSPARAELPTNMFPFLYSLLIHWSGIRIKTYTYSRFAQRNITEYMYVELWGLAE